MATTYTLQILQLRKKDIDDLSNVVVSIEYSYTGNDGTNETTFYDREDLTLPEAGSFVSYETLTEETVASWCDVTKVRVLVDRQLEIMQGTIVDSGYFPWQS
jgi:hypothetical protein